VQRVRELARRVHSIKDGEKVLGVFEAYLDESGTGKPYFAVGGLVGPADDWIQFSQDWEAIIQPLGIKAYHAADCEDGRGEFRGWPREKRNALTVSLIDCISKRKFFAVGLGAIVADYQEVLHPKADHLYRDLYALLLRYVIATAVTQMAQRLPGQHLAVICDWQEEFDGAGIRMFRSMAEDIEWQYSQKLDSITYESRAKFLPLQAADQAAYEAYKLAVNKFTDPNRPARMSMYRLFDLPFYIAYCNKDAFWSLSVETIVNAPLKFHEVR
jgi:uncharacterized protein DUF3800